MLDVVSISKIPGCTAHSTCKSIFPSPAVGWRSGVFSFLVVLTVPVNSGRASGGSTGVW